ncbi:hypothetical protein BBOV_III011935 [Babesia bovis T2Bo]|uniref:hypothetical protein n=1 Tax=Babesia bovis T2Bo TaxID=484906 RepID=UPI001C366001|nr:hypothetical protein BBOV_III011935 [Babesia bovis T2Bo]KAG6440081.1 hypothetical protein BBOV_III011935 [Babesia bovis T2Bo]
MHYDVPLPLRLYRYSHSSTLCVTINITGYQLIACSFKTKGPINEYVALLIHWLF